MKVFNGYQKGVNLGGWLSQCPHTIERYETFIAEEDIKKISLWGCDHIRLPVDCDLLENKDGVPTEYGESYIQRAIDWCKKYGLNLIVDLHKAPGFFFGNKSNPLFEDETIQERFYVLWERLAKSFGKYSDCVAFELLNEVTSPSYRDIWNDIACNAIKRIRAFAPNTYILFGQYWHNSVETVQYIANVDDDKVIYNFHCYEPMFLTHQGAGWCQGIPRDLRMKYPDTLENYKAKYIECNYGSCVLKTPVDNLGVEFYEWLFASAIKTAEERDVALYCGEYGIIDNCDPESVLNWYKVMNQIFTKYGIGRAAWSYKQMSFGLSDEHMTPVIDELVKYL